MDIRPEDQLSSASVDAVPHNREIVDMWAELKKVIGKEVEVKKKLEQKLEFIEDNGDWSKTYTNRLQQQLDEYKNAIESLTRRLKTMDDITEKNKQLEEHINRLNATLRAAEEASDLSMNDMQKRLEAKDKEISDMSRTIDSKEILLSQQRRDITDIQTKNEENLEEMKRFYEKKICDLHKEYDQKQERLLRQNDEKIIEIRAHCMHSIEKNKESYEAKCARLEFQNKELKEQSYHQKLQLEAFKTQKGTKTGDYLKTLSAPKSVPKAKVRDGERRASLNMRGLEPFGSDREEPNVSGLSSASKRKKLAPISDSFMDIPDSDD